MRSLFLVFLVSASLGFGRRTLTPDCVLPFSFSSSRVSPVFDDTLVACQARTVDYEASSTGSISSLSLAFQSADGTTTPGTFGGYREPPARATTQRQTRRARFRHSRMERQSFRSFE